MLIEFSVGNYRSFNAPVTLSMQTGSLHSRNQDLNENNTFQLGNLGLVRSAAIYGANASGKSNLVRALGWMRNFILQSSRDSQVGEAITVEPFLLNTATQQAPSYFQIIFHLNGKRYRYGFEVDKQAVQAEWLYHTAQRETRLFIREGAEYDLSSVFKEGRGLASRTRSNALFLSVVAQFNGALAMALLAWFKDALYVLLVLPGWEDLYSDFTLNRGRKDGNFVQQVQHLMRALDLGITGFTLRRSSQPTSAFLKICSIR